MILRSFNLIDEPWIRARMHNGAVRSLTISQALRLAPQIKGLAGEIPTQDVAIFRLLEAIILAATRPPARRSEDEILDMWEQWWTLGTIPPDAIDPYLETVHSRFDLLDEIAPFMQVAGLTTASGNHSGLAKLIADFPDGHPFFTVRGGPGVQSLSLSEAARWLVHCQAFDPSGIKTGAVGDPRVKGGRGYPFGYPAWAGNLGIVLAEGTNLFESLMLNLPWSKSGPNDLPVWDRPVLGPGVEEPVHLPEGPADLFTWPSRRIRLFVQDDRVVDVQISNGDKLTPQDRFVQETMSAWRHSKNQSSGSVKVHMPVLHDPSRYLWQGLGPLLQVAGEETKPAFVVDWLARLRNDGILDPGHLIDLRVVGLRYGTQNSVITSSVDDRLSVPLAALTDPTLKTIALSAAQRAAKGVVAFANLAGALDRAAGGDGIARENAFEFGYSQLNDSYRGWIRALIDPDDASAYESTWDRITYGTLIRLGEALLAQAGTAAIVGRRVLSQTGDEELLDAGLAEIRFRAALGRALPFKNDEVQL